MKAFMVHQPEYSPQRTCKSVRESSTMANSVHEEDVSSRKGEKSPLGFWRLKEPYTGKFTRRSRSLAIKLPKCFLKWYLLCTLYPVHSTQYTINDARMSEPGSVAW